MRQQTRLESTSTGRAPSVDAAGMALAYFSRSKRLPPRSSGFARTTGNHPPGIWRRMPGSSFLGRSADA